MNQQLTHITNPIAPTTEELKIAHETSWRRYGPTVKGLLDVAYETSMTWSQTNKPFPYIRLSAIHESLRATVNELFRGSAYPSIDETRETMYVHDVERFLRALGYRVNLVEKVAT
jgi:hypothetical protein